ncbi:MAG: GLPGLI family protein [Saprospiraceae bacterium]
MKKILFLLLVFSFQCAFGQSSGVINFSEAIKLQLDMQGGDAEMMKKIPQFHSVQKTLFFNDKESLYKNADKNTDLEVSNNEGGNDMKFVVKSPESILYNDLANTKMVNSQEFFGKQFLVKGDMTKRMWKITGESKILLDYTCQKAILQDTANEVVAWFTTKLPANLGPQSYTGLPGAILLVDIDNGQRIITANKIEIRELKSDEITIPTKGKVVTPEEFEKIKKDKMEEMGGTMGKGGTMRIMIRQDAHN